MGTHLFGCTHQRTNSLHLTMNSFVVFTTLLAAACAAPQTVVNTVNEGPQTGPLTPLVGGLILTPKGFRSIDLEGFSEDLNEDGFVDPIVPAVPAPILAPAHIAPVYNSVHAVSPYFPQAPIAAPVFNSAAPVFNGAAPVFANDALLYNGAAPFFNGAAPVFNTAAPVFNTAAPVFNPAALVFNTAAPVFNGAAPVFNSAAPVFNSAASAFFNPAPVASPVFSAPTTVARTSVAPSPAVFRTISPLPVPVRAAPSAVVYDSRLHG